MAPKGLQNETPGPPQDAQNVPQNQPQNTPHDPSSLPKFTSATNTPKIKKKQTNTYKHSLQAGCLGWWGDAVKEFLKHAMECT